MIRIFSVFLVASQQDKNYAILVFLASIFPSLSNRFFCLQTTNPTASFAATNREHYGVINALPQLARKYFSELFIYMMILSNPPRKVEEADSTTSATGDCAPMYAPVPLASQTVPLQQMQQPRQEVSTTQTYPNSFM